MRRCGFESESIFFEFTHPAASPLAARDEVVLSHVVFTQFLSEWFGVTLGKLDTTGGDMNEFAHVRGDQFMNLAFSASPLITRTAPYAPLGIGFVFLPTKDPNHAILSFSAIDTEAPRREPGLRSACRTLR